MKKLVAFLSGVIIAATFLFIQHSPIDKKATLVDKELLESVAGDRDNPDAAFRFRFAMLAGNQQNVDLVKMRREAISYSDRVMKSASGLRKTSAATWSGIGPGNIGGRGRSVVLNPTNRNF